MEKQLLDCPECHSYYIKIKNISSIRATKNGLKISILISCTNCKKEMILTIEDSADNTTLLNFSTIYATI